MAGNKRQTFATTQVSIKDNRMDATNDILGFLPNGTLASGVASTDGQVAFTQSLSGVWPEPGQFRVKEGSDIEYIRYASFLNATTVGGLTRGTAGTTVTPAITSGKLAQLIGWEVVLGAQTASMSTAFNNEDVFHIGQLGSYENREGVPDVEVGIERVLDGTKPLWLSALDPDQTTLKGKTASFSADVAYNFYPDTQDSATGTPDSVVVGSGMFVTSYTLTMPTGGENFTESITLQGNDKTWNGEEGTPSGYFPTESAFDATVVGSGVQRSENFDKAASTLPTDLPVGDKIQSIEVTVDLAREDIFEIGLRRAFFRPVTFPVTVTTTFTTITDKGDLIDAISDGRTNLSNQTIILKTSAGLTINLGTKNKIQNVNLDGFDAGGGNGQVTLEYSNSNVLTITHDGFVDFQDTNQDNN